MAEKGTQREGARLPHGFTVRSAGPASEKARELGWGINEEERTKTPMQKQNYDGGTANDKGPQEFSHTPLSAVSAKPPADRPKSRPGRPKKAA